MQFLLQNNNVSWRFAYSQIFTSVITKVTTAHTPVAHAHASLYLKSPLAQKGQIVAHSAVFILL
jgi:hypothetical protein